MQQRVATQRPAFVTIRGMLDVPVLVPSHAFSGASHSFAVGEQQSWRLVAPPDDDFPIPDEFLATIAFDSERVERHPTGSSAVLRAGGLTAYWERAADEPPPRQLRGWFRTITTENAPEDMPETLGIVTVLRAISVFYPTPSGGRGARHWAKVMGVRSVSHTSESGPVGTVHPAGAVLADIDLMDGEWWDAGWLATLAVSD
jgi:hypothetical protein